MNNLLSGVIRLLSTQGNSKKRDENITSLKNDLKLFAASLFRGIRIIMGLFVIFIISFNMAAPQLMPVTGKSIVNAKLNWVRTPIEGNVTFSSIAVGSSVSSGEHIGSVINDRADDNFLNQLELQKAAIETSQILLQEQYNQYTAERIELNRKLSQSLNSLELTTGVRIDTLRREIVAARESKEQLNNQIRRYEIANFEYSSTDPHAIVSRAMIEDLKNQRAIAALSIHTNQNQLVILQQELESATRGEFNSQSTPEEKIMLKSIDKNIARLTTELSSFSTTLDGIQNKILERERHLQLIRSHNLVSKVNGIVWDISVADGAYVKNGDSVIGIANTDTLMVESVFHQRYLEDIAIGDHASVLLMGSKKRISGVVSRLMIRDHSQSKNLNAFSIDELASDEFKVLISLDSGERHIPIIGQRAKVLISENKNDPMSRMISMINR